MNPKQWTIGKCAAMLMIAGGTVMSSEAGWEAELQKLPAAEGRPPSESSEADWLIDNSDYEAGVFKTDKPGEITLENGLIRRTFRLAPNGATVGFDNLVTGQAIIRGVKPEGQVTIDGKPYNIGGLTGQRNYAFILPEQIDSLKADPKAMKLVGFKVGVPKERFGWKQIRHHAPDAKWPPKGTYLRMDYVLPGNNAQVRDPLAITATDREMLVEDALMELDAAWKVHASKAHDRSSFVNEAKVGEIYTPANTAVFAERPLPKEAAVVELTLTPGTDTSGSWGPGMALVFPDRVIKLNIRSDGSPRLGLYDGKKELPNFSGNHKIDSTKPLTLRFRLEKGAVRCDVRPEGGKWVFLGRVDIQGQPTAVRVGKMDLEGGSKDHSDVGELVRLKIMDFAVYGRAKEKAGGPASGIQVSVHYELYDGVPVLSKWLTVHNNTDKRITVDRFTAETLAVVEPSNPVDVRKGAPLLKPDVLHVETDMAFSSFRHDAANRHAIHWHPDPQFGTQVNYQRMMPCLLVVEPTYGPSQDVQPGKSFETFRVFELVHDNSERERRGLALRQMYRTVAPWVTENPLMFHVKSSNPAAVKKGVDQCAAVGFEMLIMSFGSGFNMENDSPAYLKTWKEVADYAESKGIEIGSYSLLASRNVGNGSNVVSPEGERPAYGNCPALTSKWGQDYFRKLYNFFEKTGFDLLEHDGSYPGDVDVTARPPLQKGVNDSRWVQWRIISDYYKWCCANGIYLNVPDYYYLAGSTKCGMGYREVNWSLPRAEQVFHTRQNIYDGTWQKTPSMGWMFVPLSQYHGGGAAATIEPLDEHRDHYERMLYSNLGMGVQACYRGPRLYDTEATKTLVKKWVDWFKQYRDILESDMIHGRRADGRDIDWMLHVNPKLQNKGMLVVFNPLKIEVKRTLDVPLYYTGLTDEAKVSVMGAKATTIRLDRRCKAKLEVTIPAEGMAWYVITEAGR